MGLSGRVISDWAGVHDTRGAVLGGLDLEMGTDKAYDDFYLAKAFREGVKNGTYPQAVLDDKVRRNLRVMIGTGVFDPRPKVRSTPRRIRTPPAAWPRKASCC
jgi:beta-glucosidase